MSLTNIVEDHFCSSAPKPIQATEGSHLFIVGLSKNYASSTWCLGELAQICNCIQKSSIQVLCIFYDVDPSVIQKYSGHYEKAFVKHEEKFKDKEKMEDCRQGDALTKVANLFGWDIKNKYTSLSHLMKDLNLLRINALSPIMCIVLIHFQNTICIKLI